MPLRGAAPRDSEGTSRHLDPVPAFEKTGHLLSPPGPPAEPWPEPEALAPRPGLVPACRGSYLSLKCWPLLPPWTLSSLGSPPPSPHSGPFQSSSHQSPSLFRLLASRGNPSNSRTDRSSLPGATPPPTQTTSPVSCGSLSRPASCAAPPWLPRPSGLLAPLLSPPSAPHHDQSDVSRTRVSSL